MPDSSHDREDVERYILGRDAGLTRREAGAHILAQGREVRVLKRIEKTFARCLRNWTAIFAVDIPESHAYEILAKSVLSITPISVVTSVFLDAAQYALSRGINVIFSSRSSILFFRDGIARGKKPLNMAFAKPFCEEPDSS